MLAGMYTMNSATLITSIVSLRCVNLGIYSGAVSLHHIAVIFGVVIKFFIYLLFLNMDMHATETVRRSEDKFVKSLLSFHLYVGLGVRVRSLDLPSVFTH